jgi:hypothetical protein
MNCAGVPSVHDLCVHGNGGERKRVAHERVQYPFMVDLAPLLGSPDMRHHPCAACRQLQLAELRTGMAPVDHLAGSAHASTEHVRSPLSPPANSNPSDHRAHLSEAVMTLVDASICRQ